MKWSESHDILFAREVLVSSLYETRNGSPERGKVWDEIAENLNKLENPLFGVSKRSLRDRLSLLIKSTKLKSERKTENLVLIQKKMKLTRC